MSLEVTFLFSQCGISAVKLVSKTLRFFSVVTQMQFLLMIQKLRGDRKESGFLENMVFPFYEFSTTHLSVQVIYAVGISGHVLSHFLGHEEHCNRRLWRKQKCFLPITHFYSNVYVHTLSPSHARKSTYTLIVFLYFPWRIVPQKSTFKGKRLML